MLRAGGREPVLCQVCVPLADIKPVQCWGHLGLFPCKLVTGPRLGATSERTSQPQKPKAHFYLDYAFGFLQIHSPSSTHFVMYSYFSGCTGWTGGIPDLPPQLQEEACGPGLDTAPCIPVRLDARLCTIGAISTKPGCLWNLLESGSCQTPEM